MTTVILRVGLVSDYIYTGRVHTVVVLDVVVVVASVYAFGVVARARWGRFMSARVDARVQVLSVICILKTNLARPICLHNVTSMVVEIATRALRVRNQASRQAS